MEYQIDLNSRKFRLKTNPDDLYELMIDYLEDKEDSRVEDVRNMSVNELTDRAYQDPEYILLLQELGEECANRIITNLELSN